MHLGSESNCEDAERCAQTQHTNAAQPIRAQPCALFQPANYYLIITSPFTMTPMNSLPLFQSMVDGQTGLRGHRVVSHAEMEQSRGHGNVRIHRLPTAEQDVQGLTQKTKSATKEPAQVTQIITRSLFHCIYFPRN